MRAIQVFEAVVRCGGVTSAANELCVSPGAVSQQLHNIERSLRVRIFERSGRVLALTPWGRLYYERVHAAFDQLRSAQDTLERARLNPGITLSALPALAVGWLRPLLAQWQQAHPKAKVRLIASDDEPALGDGTIDFRLSYASNLRRYENFSELFIDTVVPAASPRLLEDYPVASPEDILAAPLIHIETQFRQPFPTWDDWARHAGIAPPTATREIVFTAASTAIDAAIRNCGFVLAPSAMIADEIRTGRLVVPVGRRLAMTAPYILAWDPAALDRSFGEKFRSFMISAHRQSEMRSRGR
jgi:LysR family glycine cleavage system transcriptional activator